jgi:hypothetical protein
MFQSPSYAVCVSQPPARVGVYTWKALIRHDNRPEGPEDAHVPL